MALIKKTELILDQKFNPQTCRHTLNDQVMVLHCHHYATLYSQLADDCSMLDGKALLAQCAEDTFCETFASYFREHGIESLADRIAIAEQYYSNCGLGKIKVVCAGLDAGEIELTHSHVDAGWIKKWGKRDKPVNFITQGFIAALFAALFNRPPRSYQVVETASIVTGAPVSKFNVIIN
jgi:hypothetical protein